MKGLNNLSGETIRGYQLADAIGSGGFGAVYRAYQPAVDREVAIKVILPEFAQHPDFVARFEAEARTVAKLEHPHIVPLYDYWHDDQGAFLVMRYLKGGSLRERLDEDSALDPEEAVRIMKSICQALQAAHDQGVIHRDLKPENILLDERRDAYLTDFGIAKDLSAKSLTMAGAFTGSAGYLAPEQAKAERITPATDIYLLGVLLYEMLVGEHPFPDLTPLQLIQHHLNEPLPLASQRRPDLPPIWDELIQRATAKEPEARHPSVRAWAEDLRIALEAPRQIQGKELPAFMINSTEIRRPTFVGREAELAWLDLHLEAALAGHGRVVFVTGGPGRGKTALVSEFAHRAFQKHPNLIAASGSANAFSGLGDPYLPFRDILSMLTGEVEAKWASGQVSTEQARSLWKLTPTTVAALLDHGPELIDVFVEVDELAARAAAASTLRSRLNSLRALRNRATRSVQQTQLFEQYTTVLRALAEDRPVLLFLDDLQWADGASIGLLFHLGRRLEGSSILLVGTYREEEVALGREGGRHPIEKVVAEMRQAFGDVRLALDESQERDGREFVDALLDSEPNELRESFRAALFRQTGGHPLFAIELLRSMQERGDLLKDEHGRWVEGASLNWDQLPEKVEAVIQERIGRLEDELHELLSVASVEGDAFTAQVIAQVQQVQERQLLRQLSQELERRHRLVREHGEARVGARILSRYRFGHHLFQRYLYNELSAGERRLLHREVADALETLYNGQLDEITVQLAQHYLEAGDTAQALSHLVLAGQRARRLFANPEALGHFDRALDLSEQPSDDLLSERAAVLVDLYRGQEAVRDYEKLLATARSQGDRPAELKALLGLGRGQYILSLDHPETGAARHSQRYYEQAHELASELGDKHGVIKSLVPTIWFGDFWPEYEAQARANAQEAYEASQSIDDDMLKVEAELAMFYTSPYEERVKRGERLLERLEAAGDLTRLNYLLFGMMFSSLGIGEFETTIRYCDRGIAVASRIGVPPVQYPTLKAIALGRLGQFDEALSALEEEVADESHRLATAFKQLGRATILLELQAFARAADVLLNMRELAAELGRAWMQEWMHALLVRSVLGGNLQRTIDLGPTLEYLRELESAAAAVALGEYELAEGKLEGAQQHAKRARAIAERSGRRPDMALALELEARIQLAAADGEGALQSAHAGVELAEALNCRPLLWRLLARKAEALDGLSRTDEAQRERERSAQLILELADHVSDEAQRVAFLGSPAVVRILESAGTRR